MNNGDNQALPKWYYPAVAAITVLVVLFIGFLNHMVGLI